MNITLAQVLITSLLGGFSGIAYQWWIASSRRTKLKADIELLTLYKGVSKDLLTIGHLEDSIKQRIESSYSTQKQNERRDIDWSNFIIGIIFLSIAASSLLYLLTFENTVIHTLSQKKFEILLKVVWSTGAFVLFTSIGIRIFYLAFIRLL